MFRVSLLDLDRAGNLDFEREIPLDHSLWEGSGVAPAGPVRVRLRITATPTGQVVARGELRARMDRQCRRCLATVDPVVEERVEMVWSVPDQLRDVDADDGEIRTLDPGSGELDLGPALREELILAAPVWVLCEESCRGLCPACGANWNETECECSFEEPDPRWDALRALKHE